MLRLGVDIGGSGIKGAVVDIDAGSLVTDRHEIPTPQPSRPDAVVDAVTKVVAHFAWEGPIGFAFPAIVVDGVVHSAANIDESWIGTDARSLLAEATGRPVALLNDADAAGLGEMHFGAGKGEDGVVFVLTLGSGIGSAVFVDGHLMPNTELGHLELDGSKAEHRAAARLKEEEHLSWEEWADRAQRYLTHLEAIFSPDLFILGGGVSRDHNEFLPLLKTRARLKPATLRNDAGIVGAALTARDLA
ncbi:MAG: polyphosphate--glucose phosphotransferase [Acidimicrobiia bacterium]